MGRYTKNSRPRKPYHPQIQGTGDCDLYECLICKEDISGHMSFKERKGRVIAHILVKHRQPEEVSFICSICVFRAHDRIELSKHLTKRCHTVAVVELLKAGHDDIAIASQDKYTLGTRAIPVQEGIHYALVHHGPRISKNLQKQARAMGVAAQASMAQVLAPPVQCDYQPPVISRLSSMIVSRLSSVIISRLSSMIVSCLSSMIISRLSLSHMHQ